MSRSPSLTTPLVPDSLAQQAFERLEGAIMRGELAPGARISEADIARQFGISRGPLREAMGRLEGRKLVERTTNVGARVVSLAPDDLLELYTVREALEGMACRLAAERIRPKDLRTLGDMLHRHEADRDVLRGVAYVQAKGDQDFHFKIASLSGNRKLISLLCDELYSLLRLYRLRFSAVPGRPQQALQEHFDILEALRGGDPDAAEAAMRRHVRNSRDNLLLHAREGDRPDLPLAPPRRAARRAG